MNQKFISEFIAWYHDCHSGASFADISKHSWASCYSLMRSRSIGHSAHMVKSKKIAKPAPKINSTIDSLLVSAIFPRQAVSMVDVVSKIGAQWSTDAHLIAHLVLEKNLNIDDLLGNKQIFCGLYKGFGSNPQYKKLDD